MQISIIVLPATSNQPEFHHPEHGHQAKHQVVQVHCGRSQGYSER